MSAQADPAFRILAFSTDGDAEARLRAEVQRRVEAASFPAQVVAEKGVVTAAVDLIIGLSAADVDRAARFLPEGATVAFTVTDLANALSPTAGIDQRWLVTDVRPVTGGEPPTVQKLKDAVARARRNAPVPGGEGLGERDLGETLDRAIDGLSR
ncbi:hypothetical protein [Paramicrobacterium agarici]|uniref:hypothetical protein n=1 Tax=Paramicrobacterium agarici TaxID=630514 RepID=UPI001154E243|nr:hypothetical protein [Microbacterium agarici]TQO23705.1 hypothetical protein FB385_2563 [Microbacterium agarici]